MKIKSMVVIAALLSYAVTAIGQEEQAIRNQIKQLEPLKKMDGLWRGTATIVTPTGERLKLIQTERVGALLGGAVKVVEGRGYDEGGETRFNALGIISYDNAKRKLMMRSYAQGRTGDFEIKLTDDGFEWEIPMGPATIRYAAKLTAETWHEFGERVVDGQKPMRFFEMKLKRIGDSRWPAVDPVATK